MFSAPGVERAATTRGTLCPNLRILLGPNKAPLSALVDSGNLCGPGLVLSPAAVKAAGLKMERVRPLAIGTAAKGGSLTLVGQVRNVRLELKERVLEHPVAWVLQELTTGVNLGYHFLRLHKLSLQFGSPAPLVKFSDGHSQKMVNQLHQETAKAEVPNDDATSSTNANDDVTSSDEPIVDDTTITDSIVEDSPGLDPDSLGMLRNHVNKKLFPTRNKVSNKVCFRKSRAVSRPMLLCQLEGATLQGQVIKNKILLSDTMSKVQVKVDRRGVHSIKVNHVMLDAASEVFTVEGVYPVRSNKVEIMICNPSSQHHLLRKGFPLEVISLTEQEWIPPKEDTPGDGEGTNHMPTNVDDAETAKVNAMKKEDNFEKLWSELKIDKNSLLKKHTKVRKKLRSLIYKYQDVFTISEESSVGHTDLMEAHLRVQPGTEPVMQKRRQFNPGLERDLAAQVDKWLREGVVSPSESPWSNPLVPVRKRDNTIRWAVDFRLLNKHIIKDSYPLPRIDHLINRCAGAQVYSSLDASQAYFTIPLSAESRAYTAFQTNEGLFEFNKLPFGISTAVSIYSRFIATVLNPLGSKGLSVYLDDILIFSSDMEGHLSRLEEVLAAHRKAGIKLKASKCQLFVQKVTYLGHELTPEGVGMVEEYVQRVMDWPVPTTPKELSRFLGFVSYYRSFIRDFSLLTEEMSAQKRKKKLEWTPIMDEKFVKLKEAFREAPVRAGPDFESDQPFLLTTDYSGGALSAILSQEQGGQERLIAASGRKTTKGEKNYPSWRGELAALVYGARKFHHILSYKPFVVYTDSAALKHLSTLKPTAGILSRWYEELANLDFEVIHRKGKDNLNADALSRATHLPPPDEEEEREQGEWIGHLTAEDLELEGTHPGQDVQQLSRELLLEAQGEDEILRKVRGWLSAGKLPSKEEIRGEELAVHRYRQIAGSIKITEDGLLVLETGDLPVVGKKQLILVPDSLRSTVFHYVHRHRTAGHYGLQATRARLLRNFYYPNIMTDLGNRIKLCQECLGKVTKETDKQGVHKPLRHGYPLQCVAIDLVGPLEGGNHGFNYILTVEDLWTRYVQAYPLKSKHTMEVARTLMERFVASFGCPSALHSDQGKEFTSHVMQHLMKELQVEKTVTPPYNPRSNGKLERFHRDLGAFMRTTLVREDPGWVMYLPALVLAHNSKQHSSTGLTPMLAFLGREARLPLDLIIELPRNEPPDLPGQVRMMLDRYRKVYKYVRAKGDAVIRRNSQQYAGKKLTFQPGALCWYLSPRKVEGKSLKITNRWVGPVEVVEQRAEVLVAIRNPSSPKRVVVVHTGRLRPYQFGHAKGTITRNELEGEDDDLEAEEVATKGGGPVSINIPVQIPQHVPKMEDKGGGSTLPRQLDPVEESQPRMARGTEVQDELEPERRGQTRERSTSPEDRGPRVRRKHEPRRGIVRSRSTDNSEPERPLTRARIERRGVTRPRETDTSDTDRPTTRPKTDTPMSKLIYPDSDSSEGSVDALESVEILLSPGSGMPSRQSNEAAVYDVRAAETRTLLSGRTQAVELDLVCQVPPSHFMKLSSRPGLLTQGIHVMSDVANPKPEQNVIAYLWNSSTKPFTVKKGTRIARVAFLRHHAATFVDHHALSRADVPRE